jgi:hypothetical protein
MEKSNDACSIDQNERIPPDLMQKIRDLGILDAAFAAESGGGRVGEVGCC